MKRGLKLSLGSYHFEWVHLELEITKSLFPIAAGKRDLEFLQRNLQFERRQVPKVQSYLRLIKL